MPIAVIPQTIGVQVALSPTRLSAGSQRYARTFEEKLMSNVVTRASVLLTAIGTALFSGGWVSGQTAMNSDAIVVRIEHPERQAAAMLELFKGARAAHPAAALAGWKRATRNPHQLAKPLEAVVALFNPEMASEWRVLHGAELRWDWNETDGGPRWLATAPGDDGTLAAAITAQRITQGTDDRPLVEVGKAFKVERLGSAPGILASQVGDGVVVAGTREDLRRGIASLVHERPPAAERDRGTFDFVGLGTAAGRFDSGLLIRIEPGRLKRNVGPIAYRRGVAALHGVGCEKLTGVLALQDDIMALKLNTAIQKRQRNAPAVSNRAAAAGVDPTWLARVPAERTMAAFSLAIAPGPEFWESAFALADCIEHADPERANVAPLRSRINLMAAAAGVRIEADLWCHLIGVTASVFADRDQTGRIGGIVVILHVDNEQGAARIAAHVIPGLASLFLGTNRGRENRSEPVAGQSQRLGALSGGDLFVSQQGRDVVISWGEEAQARSRDVVHHPQRSMATFFPAGSENGKSAPQRLGVIWPARCWPPSSRIDRTSAGWRVLADDPPVLWRGWTDGNQAHDQVTLPGVKARVHAFLSAIPLDPSPLR